MRLPFALALLFAAACESPSLPCPTCVPGDGGGGAGGAGEGGLGAGGASIQCPPSGVYHGPWSLRFDDAGAVVRWDACAQGSAEITVTPEATGGAQTFSGVQTAAEVTTSYVFPGVLPDLPGTFYTTDVAVSGLEPGACYGYAIASDPTLGGRFCTAKPPGAPLSFMAIGDTIPGLGPTEEIFEQVLPLGPDFTVHTGDIQYYSSVVDSWAAWFVAMRPMLTAGAFLPSIGNHESENATEYADYYDRLFADAGFDGTRTYYRFQSGGVWFFSLDTEQDLDPGTEQGIWLAQTLEDAAASPGFRGSVLYMHRPLITVGDAGSNPGLRALLEPLFLEHGVVLVLAGHMHGYERFVSMGLTYITTAGGGGAIGDVDENVEERPEEAALRVASAGKYHATFFEITETAIEGRAIDPDGDAFDTFSVPLPAPLP